MRVKIAGGPGLVGRELVSHLATSGREVIVVARTHERVTGPPDPPIN